MRFKQENEMDRATAYMTLEMKPVNCWDVRFAERKERTGAELGNPKQRNRQ
jgi:hypothetical protein